MEFNNMNELDLKLFLLSGYPIYVENLPITPSKISEIIKYGLSDYMDSLKFISLSVDDFMNSIGEDNKKSILEKKIDNLKSFDFYMNLGGKGMREDFLNVISMIFKTKDITVLRGDIIALDFHNLGIITSEDGDVDEEKLDKLPDKSIKLIHRDNFDDVVKVIKLQNYFSKVEDEVVVNENPVDEETRKLQEHMRKMNKKVEERKKMQESDEDRDIDISDIISSITAKSNSIDKFNVWELTVYQIYDEYARLEVIDNYDFSIRAMMAGAKDVDLNHWSRKL